MGVYIFSKKKIFKLIKNKNTSLENDILPNLIKNKKISGIKTKNFFLDIGTPENFKKAKKIISKKFIKRAAFLDRDGVINFDKGYVHKIKDFKFRPNVIKGLKFLRNNDYYIFVVTNQAFIAKNKFSIK